MIQFRLTEVNGIDCTDIFEIRGNPVEGISEKIDRKSRNLVQHISEAVEGSWWSEPHWEVARHQTSQKFPMRF